MNNDMTAEAQIGRVPDFQETGKMGGALSKAEGKTVVDILGDADAYRRTLQRAKVPPERIKQLVRAYKAEHEVKLVKPPLPFSHTAEACIQAAIDCGVDIRQLNAAIESAAAGAIRQHRTKIGFFGEPGRALSAIRGFMDDRQRLAANKA